ncbi:MAG: TonB-dependent receptor [Bacteroidales bacterium]|nr:TonB-dependent receptor [Bacteroidales bacterium]
MYRFAPLILIILILLSGFSIFAQPDTSFFKVDILGADDLSEPVSDDEIEIISASRSSKKLKDLPVTIEVITREDILLNGYITLADVLKSLPGIKVSQPGSGELGEMFLMRGMLGNKYTKILIDNIPVKPSVVSGMPIESQLPIRQAERIEIVYGPASAVFGADATVGVINIITKSAESGIFSEADIILGENGYSYINFHAGGKAGRNRNILKYNFYGSKVNFERMNIFNDTSVYHPLDYLEQKGLYWLNGGDTVRPTQLTTALISSLGLDQSDLFKYNYEGTLSKPAFSNISTESHIVGLDLRYRGFGISYQNMARKTHSSIGKTPFLYKYNNPQNYFGDIINRVTLSFIKDIDRFNTTTNLSFMNYSMDNNSSYGVTFIPEHDKVYQYSASNDIFGEEVITYFGKYFEITGGISFQLSVDLPYTNYLLEPFEKEQYNKIIEKPGDFEDYKSFGLNPYSFFNISEFIQTYFEFNKFIVMGGIRHDYNSLYEASSFNPRAAVLYKLDSKTTVRASYGRAFKAPAGNVVYNSLAYPIGVDSIFYAVVPNTDLKPEFFRAYEFGIRRKLIKDKVFVNLAFYYNKTDNIITTAYVNPKELNLPNAVNDTVEPARTYINSEGAESKLFGLDGSLVIINPVNKYKLKVELIGTITKGREILPDGDVIEFFRTMPSYIGKGKVSLSPSRRTYLIVQTTWMSRVQKIFKTNYGSFIFGDYSESNGFFTIDLTGGFRFHKNLNIFFKINNLLDKTHSGIDGTGYDVDLRYNPQLGRNIRFGMTFLLN